ncbi:MAG: hypothetical protein WDM87_15925 [Terracidiphilus sp.]
MKPSYSCRLSGKTLAIPVRSKFGSFILHEMGIEAVTMDAEGA